MQRPVLGLIVSYILFVSNEGQKHRVLDALESKSDSTTGVTNVTRYLNRSAVRRTEASPIRRKNELGSLFRLFASRRVSLRIPSTYSHINQLSGSYEIVESRLVPVVPTNIALVRRRPRLYNDKPSPLVGGQRLFDRNDNQRID